jgi:hypothetical protein
MGKIRQHSVMNACPTCEAPVNSPCVHRLTKKPIQGMHRARTWKVKAGIKARELDKSLKIEHYDPREQKRIMQDCVMRLSGDPADNPDDQYHGQDWKLNPEPPPPWVAIVEAIKAMSLKHHI